MSSLIFFDMLLKIWIIFSLKLEKKEWLVDCNHEEYKELSYEMLIFIETILQKMLILKLKHRMHISIFCIRVCMCVISFEICSFCSYTI